MHEDCPSRWISNRSTWETASNKIRLLNVVLVQKESNTAIKDSVDSCAKYTGILVSRCTSSKRCKPKPLWNEVYNRGEQKIAHDADPVRNGWAGFERIFLKQHVVRCSCLVEAPGGVRFGDGVDQHQLFIWECEIWLWGSIPCLRCHMVMLFWCLTGYRHLEVVPGKESSMFYWAIGKICRLKNSSRAQLNI